PQPGNPGHNQPGFPQGPGHNQPGHSGYSQPGNPGHNQPGFPQGPGHNQPGHSGYPQPGHPGHPPIYYPSIPDADDNCVTWKFTAQTPNTRTEKVTGSKKDCHLGADLQYYCSDSSEYFSRRITVNIGERKLEAWEEESLKVCLDSPSSPTLRLGGMLYEYAVASRNSSGFLGANAATVFTLTPGAKKPSAPDSQEISVGSVVAADGGVYMTLNDARADHFKGEKISIKAEGMKLDIDHTLPVDQMISSFVNFKVSGSFEVGSSYILKLMDTPKPGKYAVTVTFSRNGPLSNGASAEVMETFDLK
ncbi:MAG: hypothetical protein WCK76_00835, partial [Elusimicrobiota bacterium]